MPIEDNDVFIGLESVDDNVHKLTPKQFNLYLVQVIMKYWAAKGFVVRVRSETIGKNGKDHIHTIKSDMLNGMPMPSCEIDERKDKNRIVSPPLI